jgi:hypothetical protein
MVFVRCGTHFTHSSVIEVSLLTFKANFSVNEQVLDEVALL